MLVMPPGAKRISSRTTRSYKYLFPVFWFGFLGLFLLSGGIAAVSQPDVALPFLVAPVLMAVVGFVLMKLLIWDLLDEVWDNGKELLVVNGGHVEHVPLTSIININYSGLTNPKRATLQLRQPGRWGEKLTFIPVRRAHHFFDLTGNGVIDELIQRVDEARRKA